MTLVEQLGRIDIYVFDQLLRGNIRQGMKVLDAGCGGGRNLVYMLSEGFDIYAVDQSAEAVEAVRGMAAVLAPNLLAENFWVASIEQMPFVDGFADVVICNSVMHFAKDDEHFVAMIAELWRVLKPGGMLFCRLGSTIGMEFERLRGNIFRVGDGQEWLLVNEGMLMRLTQEMGGELVDPLKTTVVQGHRCMTTWVVRKRA
jgi:2-polyprenyl-3-methyl-5-hydroxy-6-metoxy-1,4-benzoquinol methylase